MFDDVDGLWGLGSHFCNDDDFEDGEYDDDEVDDFDDFDDDYIDECDYGGQPW